MSQHDSDLRIRPGRIRDGGRRALRPKSFVGQVMRAARKAGHTGKGFGRSGRGSSSCFGRGRAAGLALRLRSPGRRVAIKARVVRHRGSWFRPAPMLNHLAYLKRDGVTRNGADATMFDANSDRTDEQAFAERCSEDRHHFRFIVSPEDAPDMADLRAFTRELMLDAERDLGTRLDWVAVDHWNTDNPHVHVLVRGRADDGQDLVISRDYISRGVRARAEERATLELGPRTAHEVRAALERRFRLSDGRDSTGPCARASMMASASPIFAQTASTRTANFAGSCLAAWPRWNGWGSPNRSRLAAGA